MLIAHLTITMQMSTSECNKQIKQASMLMMTIQMQAYLSDEDEEIFPICQDRLDTEIELGKMMCSCTARFHYRCLV
jgi:hypothetical protein